MNRDSLGKFVIKDGKVYEVIGYIEDPCLVLEEKETGLCDTIVIGSRESKEYKDVEDYIKELNWTIEKYIDPYKVKGE